MSKMNLGTIRKLREKISPSPWTCKAEHIDDPPSNYTVQNAEGEDIAWCYEMAGWSMSKDDSIFVSWAPQMIDFLLKRVEQNDPPVTDKEPLEVIGLLERCYNKLAFSQWAWSPRGWFCGECSIEKPNHHFNCQKGILLTEVKKMLDVKEGKDD